MPIEIKKIGADDPEFTSVTVLDTANGSEAIIVLRTDSHPYILAQKEAKKRKVSVELVLAEMFAGGI